MLLELFKHLTMNPVQQQTNSNLKGSRRYTMMMILLVWQPIGWITNKVHCKLQKKEKNNTKISNYSE